MLLSHHCACSYPAGSWLMFCKAEYRMENSCQVSSPFCASLFVHHLSTLLRWLQGVYASIEYFWKSLLIGCDVASPYLLCFCVIFGSQSMFLLLLHHLFFLDLCAFSCSPSCIPPLYFVSVSFFFLVLFLFSAGSHFLEHIGDQECVKEKGLEERCSVSHN